VRATAKTPLLIGSSTVMLQNLRDHTHGWIAKIVISLLIVSFALWGIHSYFAGGSANPNVAKVNNIDISKMQLAAAYERLRRQTQLQSASKEELPATAERNLKEHALQELISTEVLKQASLAQRYRISRQQMDSFLESMPQFQVNGQFSMTRFQQALALTLYTPGDFLNLISTSLLIDQPRLGMIFTSFALPNEVDDAIALVNQERDIEYIALPYQLVAKKPLSISEDKIQSYYEQHKDDFKTTEEVSVEYVLLSVNDFINKIHPTDAELKSYYDENVNSFAQPVKDKSKNTTAIPFEKVKDKVSQAYKRQKAEEQFANAREKLANLTYEHPDSLKFAAQELGLSIQTSKSFSREKGNQDISANDKIREAAFSSDVLNSQNNSDVIQYDPDSVIVIRVKSHLPAAVLALNAVQSQIVAKLQAIEVDNKTQELANEILQKISTATDINKVLQSYSISLKTVGMIGRHSTKVDSAILDAAFSLPKPAQQKVSYGVAKIPNGYAIIGVKAVKEGQVQGKDEARVFAEQIQNTQGLLEYELYKQSLMKQAKIVLSS
jgi:hypothetical protein